MENLFEWCLQVRIVSDKGLFGFDDLNWLKSAKKSIDTNHRNEILRTVDLFAGCGGLVLGISEWCRRNEYQHRCEFASEWDMDVLSIFRKNIQPVNSSSEDIEKLFDGDIESTKLTKVEERFLQTNPQSFGPDLLTGGPPCQGHSDLNNHTRRGDDRNNLYFKMVRAAFVLKPKVIIIENVTTVIHSKEKVVQISKEKLEKMGYHVSDKILKGVEFGVPQVRSRHFLIASLKSIPDFSVLDKHVRKKPRTLSWAISDIESLAGNGELINSTTKTTTENKKRMDWLVENNEYDLPNRLRPDCHKDGHTYPAVYGRMYWDRPAHTITAGFSSNGQGRFTHPRAFPGRTITPHEAARIQTFPDWFQFKATKRGVLKKAIGNAVPPILAIHVAEVALRDLFTDLD